MSSGKDLYCDTLLMLEKLDEWYPDSHLSAKDGYDLAMERLLEKWTDVVIFKFAAAAIPTDLELMKDQNFIDDRTELWGRDWKSHHQDRLRPEAVVTLRSNFEFLEKTLLKDGRKWILGGDNPQLADIHAGWILSWLYFDIPGALPKHLFSEQTYPNTVAWLHRYRDAVVAAKERAPQPKKLEGDDAVKTILGGEFGEPEPRVDLDDATGLKKGDQVEGWPADTGSKHRDQGVLVGLTQQETVIETKSQNGTPVRVHHPRWNFQLEAAGKHGHGDGGHGHADHHHALGSHGGDDGVGAEHLGDR